MNWNDLLQEGERPAAPINQEQERWNLVAEALRNEADFEVFEDRQERMDWTLPQWIQWGLNTFVEPVENIEGWEERVRNAFTTPFGEGSSRFWGDYLLDVADELEQGTIQEEEDREEIDDDAESPLPLDYGKPRMPTPNEQLDDDDDYMGNGRPLKLLELFKGTGSIGKAAKKLGFSIVSLDFDPIYTPDIETDILKWDYKKYHKETGYIPDLIWASPPCNTFSPFAYRLKERNTKTSTPYSARAKEGTAILRQTLKIIKYFQKLNPELLFVMENPRGMMRHDPEVKKLPNRDTTLYCFYGDVRYKPTDFFNNVPEGLDLKEGKSCNKPTVLIANLPLNKRYEIPAKLSREILETMRDAYKKPMTGGADFADTPEQIRSRTDAMVNNVLRALASYWRAVLRQNLEGQEQHQRRWRNIDRELRAYIDTIPRELRRHVGTGNPALIEALAQIREEVRAQVARDEEQEASVEEPEKYDPKKGGVKTHKKNVLKKLGLEDKGYSLDELADASGVSKGKLQKVYNRGIGAYKTNPTSVRMKGTFKKGIDAPMSQKLSKEQWGLARVYSFLDGNPKHDQDLQGGRNNPREFEDRGEEVRQESQRLMDASVIGRIRFLSAVLSGRNTDRIEQQYNRAWNRWNAYVRQVPVELHGFIVTESPYEQEMVRLENLLEQRRREQG